MNDLIKAQIDNLITFCTAGGRDDIAAMLCCVGVAVESSEVCEALLGAIEPIMISAYIEATARNN